VGRILYIDCFAGIAGDMMLAALLDAGACPDFVREQVGMIAPPGVAIETSTTSVNGIRALDLTVRLAEGLAPQPATWLDIRSRLEEADIQPRVAATAIAIFEVVAHAESRMHGVSIDKVHFHEVGAWDSIADIVGCAAAVHYLEIDAVVSSPVPVGRGFVQTRHGTLPVPAPATTEILAGVPIRGTELATEMTTPTGAALVKALATSFGPMPAMIPEQTGWGAGTKRFEDRPNLLRVIVGRPHERTDKDGEWLLESNVDDLSPEVLAHVLNLVMEQGALDAWFTPIQMKKGRPAQMLSVLCDAAQRESLKRLLFTETSTLGLRESPLLRSKLDRQTVEVESRVGRAMVKTASLDGRVVHVAPEFEDARRLSGESGLPLKQVMEILVEAYRASHSTINS